MAVPAVPVAAINQQVSSSWWNNSAAPPISFLLDPPKCSVYNGAGVSCPNSTSTLVTFDTETDDSDTMHSTSANLSRITFNTPGRYDLRGYFAFTTGTALTAFDVNIRLNAAGSSSGGTSLRTFSYGSPGGGPKNAYPSLTRVFAAADYIEWFVLQTTGATQTLQASGQYATGCQARWVSIN